MENSERHSEQLDRYFRDEMNPEEKESFLTLVEKDNELKKLFEEHNDIVKAIEFSSLGSLKAQLKQKEAGYTKSKSGISTYLKIAAGLALISVVSWLLFNDPGSEINTDQLYASNYKPYPNVVAPIDRSSEFTTKNPYALFELEEYAQALDILVSQKQSDTSAFYIAQIHMALGRNDEALRYFEQVTSTSAFHEASQWYTALAWLSNDKIDESKDVLISIQEKQGAYSQRASVLLEELE